MTYLQETNRSAITVPKLQAMREAGEKIAMLTCYDASFASLLDRAGVDTAVDRRFARQRVARPGHHASCLARRNRVSHRLRGARTSVGADYRGPAVRHIRHARRCVRERGPVDAGRRADGEARRRRMACRNGQVFSRPRHSRVRAYRASHRSPCTHSGGFKVQGKTEAGASRLLRDSRALQDAGAQLLVMEAIPPRLAAEVTKQLKIPTIGIGAGIDCSGQVLVLHDMLASSPASRRAL